MSLARVSLEAMGRKDLQALAKEHGLKANSKTAQLIDELMMTLSVRVLRTPHTLSTYRVARNCLAAASCCAGGAAR